MCSKPKMMSQCTVSTHLGLGRSLILRYKVHYCSVCLAVHSCIPNTDNLSRRHRRQIWNLGHGGPGAVPQSGSNVLPWRPGSDCDVWHYQQGMVTSSWVVPNGDGTFLQHFDSSWKLPAFIYFTLKGELNLDKKWQSDDLFYIIMNKIHPRFNQFWVILKIS